MVAVWPSNVYIKRVQDKPGINSFQVWSSHLQNKPNTAEQEVTMKVFLVLALGVWLALQLGEAAPSWARDVEDVDNMVNFDLVKRLMDEERVLRNRLENIENQKRGLPACRGKMNRNMKCVSRG